MSDDLIKRSDAIKALGDEPMVWTLEDEYTMGQRSQWRAGVTAIESIPSADRPQGEWIKVDDVSISCRCSVCGWEAHLYEDDVYGMPYCPNCGARMKGADDE